MDEESTNGLTNPLDAPQDEDIKEEIQKIIEDSKPLDDLVYSLEPDYKMGWRPSAQFNEAPIPFNFDYEDELIAEYLELSKRKVVYTGYRPKDSLEAHETYKKVSAYPYSFPDRSAYMLIGITRQHYPKPSKRITPKQIEDSSLKFNSLFEAGNLDLVAQVAENEYDLFMRTDCNSRRHHQWFYFSVKNTFPGIYRFNIQNFTKKTSLYQQGMRIAIFSQNKSEKAKNGHLSKVYSDWHRGGLNIAYRFSDLTPENSSNQSIRRHRYFYWGNATFSIKLFTHYCLSFEYEFEYPNDTVYFAYSVPYTFSKLYQFIQQIHSDKLAEKHKYLFHESSLCRSIGGLKIPLLKITSQDNSKKSLSFHHFYPHAKKAIVITARIHPGETCGSDIMHGFLKFITSSLPQAIELRHNLIFYIIPMLNPEGVIFGNYRTGLSGQDLNRKFQEPHPQLHPEICAIKALLHQIQDNMEILAYIDLHAHSIKKCVFLYGPYYPIHHARYPLVRIFAKLLGEITMMFRYSGCRFKQEPGKLTSARLVLSREFDIMNNFTIEASFHSFISAERKIVEFGEKLYTAIGRYIGAALFEYVRLLEEERMQKIQRLRVKQVKGKKHNVIKDILIAKSKPPITHPTDCSIYCTSSNSPKHSTKIIQMEDYLIDSPNIEEIAQPVKKLNYRKMIKEISKEPQDNAEEEESDSDSSSSEETKEEEL